MELIRNLFAILDLNSAKTFTLFDINFIVNNHKLISTEVEISFLKERLIVILKNTQSKFTFFLDKMSEKALWVTMFAILP